MSRSLILFALLIASHACARRTTPTPTARTAARLASAVDARAERPLDSPPSPSPPRAFRMDRMHSGRSGFTLPRRLRVRGSVASGARVSSQVAMLDDARAVFGSHDGIVYAFSIVDAAITWRLSTGDRIYSSPLVTDASKVYLGTDADRFLALTSSGALDVGLAAEDDADTSAAVAPDGTLRFAAGRTLYSVDPDLTVRWRVRFGGKLFSSPAVADDGTTIVGCQDDGVHAIDAAGAVKWRFATGGDVDAPPAIGAGGVVYVGSDDGTLYALALTDGSVRWRANLGGYIRAGVAIGLDGTLVVGTFGPGPKIVAVDAETGTTRWSIPVSGPPGRDFGVMSSALVDREGRYAIGTPEDAVLVLARDGRIESRMDLGADVDSPPVLVADGLLAVGCDDGKVYLLGD